MSTKLVILGLLQDKPLHGYEIKHIIEEHMGDWTSIAFGSIYFALGKLAEEGFIEKIATEQERNRPSRSIYQSTQTGRAEFLRLLRHTWQKIEHTYFDLDLGLFFMDTLPLDEVIGYLRQRLAQIEEISNCLNTHQSEQLAQDGIPDLARAIFDHSRVHFEAELTWTKDLLAKIEQGFYP